jgi:hypothetical protein
VAVTVTFTKGRNICVAVIIEVGVMVVVDATESVVVVVKTRLLVDDAVVVDGLMDRQSQADESAAPTA